MRNRSELHDYQKRGVDLLVNQRPGVALFLDRGMGKTIIVLTAIVDLLDRLEIQRVLVVGPLRVVRHVWATEATKWTHTKHLKISRVIGTTTEREQALRTEADIYLTNYENYVKLINQTIGEPGRRKKRKGKIIPFPFDTIVFDELTRMKHVGTSRYRAHKRIVREKFARHWGLTGTPAARHLLDVFGQYFVLDAGKRLGTNRNDFRKEYFDQQDYNGYVWTPKKGTSKAITKKVRDITLRLDSRDYLEMPEEITTDIELELTGDLQKKYKEFEDEMFIQLEQGNVEAMTAAALSMKTHQFANGAMYIGGSKTNWEEVHQIKLEAFDSIIQEANGQPILVLTTFKHDYARLYNRYKCPRLGSGVSEKEENKLIEAWKRGDLELLAGHPASVGYGLDGLQENGYILAFFSIDWNREDYDQTIGRLSRQGQSNPVVMIYRLVMLNTIDTVIRTSLKIKEATQQELFALIKQYQKTIQ